MQLEEEEEDKHEADFEPQIYSKNPTERILARQLRIQRRVDALRKQKELEEAQEAAGDDGTIKSEDQKTPIDFQVEKSIELLEKLVIEGEEHVTNVRVATEARETDRREREGFGKEKLLKELEEEAQAAAAMFNKIASKWSGILTYNDPLHINEDIQSQKERCEELIKQKDEIIANLKERLRKAEFDFAVDQNKQIEDVNTISKRIEHQIIVMRQTYREELQKVEEVIIAERQLLMESNNKKWDELYKKRDQEETSNADLRSEDYWKYVKDMDDLQRDFLELYRATTIKLENNCDELQRELERIKKDAIMNSEKLDYNYQILKKREDENMIIRSQQKRRINKLQDVINLLRKKNHTYHTTTIQQIEKLTEEIKKLSKNILDVEKKADHIALVNNEKFNKIWNMNKKRADELFKRVLGIDKVLHEQQLGLIWTAPEYTLPAKMGGTLLKSTAGLKKLKSCSDVAEETEDKTIYHKTVRQILELIGDKTGFLVEETLNSILEPYLEYERTLVRVDNVFEAFHLRDKADVDLLFEHFLPYMFCPICNVTTPEKTRIEDESAVDLPNIDMNLIELAKMDPTDKTPEAASLELTKNVIDTINEDGTVVQFGPFAIRLYDDNLKGECKGLDKIYESTYSRDIEKMSLRSASGEKQSYGGGYLVPCHYQHPLMISSVYVLKALKEFLGKYHVPKESMPNMNERLAYKRTTTSRAMAEVDIEFYWQKYLTLFPTEREQLWDALLEGLKRYHEVLKARKIVSEEVVSLRQQNTDLRRVFANYVDKKDIPY